MQTKTLNVIFLLENQNAYQYQSVSNIYRNGDQPVKQQLNSAYADAVRRADTLHNVADKHVNGDKVYMGDFHFLGRRYKKTHVVAPGNKRFPQSANEVIDD